MGSRAPAAAGPTRTRSRGLGTLHSHARRPSGPPQPVSRPAKSSSASWAGPPPSLSVRQCLALPAPSTLARGAGMRRSGATAGGATDSNTIGGPSAAAAGRRAENDGAGAVAGWLAGLGLGRYAVALLGAGWDCSEVGGCGHRAAAACRRAPLRIPQTAGGRCYCPPALSVRSRDASARPWPERRAASESTSAARVPAVSSSFLPNPVPPVSGPRPRPPSCTVAPLTAQATWSGAGGGGAAGGGPFAARGAARARAAHRRPRPVPPPHRCRCRRRRPRSS